LTDNADSMSRRGAGVARRAAAVVALVITMSISACAAAQTGGAVGNPAGMFVDPANLDPAIPAPEAVIGHAVGEKAVRYPALVRYLRTLAESSPAVTLTPYAQSHEGRALYYLTITSPANHARLAAIKADNAKLADPRTLRDRSEAERIIDRLPAVAWMAYAIHGDELSSTDAAMQLAYQLAAGTDAATAQLRDELVMHIDPLMNPDGRERYLSQLAPLTGMVPNPDYQAMQHRGLWSAGRGNHYLFDLNRDWLMQVHPETRGRAAAILSWNPHLLVDSHEMGALSTYLFDPPREPLNPYVSKTLMDWRRRFGTDQARAFDRHGWSYYTGEWHEEWYPGYSNAWGSLLGAVGLLYEQAQANAASVKQASGQVLTYRETVHHQLTSSLANLETLRANRREVLRDYLADREWAVSDQGPLAEVFLLPPPGGRDRSTFNRFLELLRHHRIETAVAQAALEAEDVVDIWGERVERRTLPPGTLVVHSAQPHRRLLHAALGFDPHMTDAFLTDERKELENHRSSRIYDVTAWNLPMAYGLEAYWAKRADIPSATPASVLPNPERPVFDDRAYYGFLIDGADVDVYRALVRLLDRDCKPRVASKPFKIGGQDYSPGTILLRALENPSDLPKVLSDVLGNLGLDVRPTETALCQEGPDLGGGRFHLLQPPRVAIASQWPTASTSFGSTWYLLDARVGLRTSPVNIQRLRNLDLRKYNVLILPNVRGRGTLAGVLDERTVVEIKTWVEAGGTLIAVGSAAAFVADAERGLSNVRLKRDVLDQLAVYEEAVERERAARHVHVDPAQVWGTQRPASPPEEETPTDDAGKPPAKDGAKPDQDALRRADEWQRLFHPQGCVAAASLDPEHWLCFGLQDRLPVLIGGDCAYMSRHPVATPVRLLDEPQLRLSGLLWPEARQRWANTAYVTVESVGRGQIILFSGDPFFRGYYEGTGRLLLNAVLLGPGMGTDTPLPW